MFVTSNGLLLQLFPWRVIEGPLVFMINIPNLLLSLHMDYA